MDVNGSNYFAEPTLIPLSSEFYYTYSKGNEQIHYAQYDPHWIGLSLHLGYKFSNLREYIKFGGGFDSYNTTRYFVQFNNCAVRKVNGDTVYYNGTGSYKERAYVLHASMGYFIETPPMFHNRSLYFFAGIIPEIGYSFGRTVSLENNFTSEDTAGTTTVIKNTAEASAKNFFYLRVEPTLGAEFLINELNGIKLTLSDGLCINNYAAVDPKLSFASGMTITTSFKIGLSLTHYFRE